MMYLVHGTIVQFVYLMESIHALFGIGHMGICSVPWHRNVSCEGNECEQTIYELWGRCCDKSNVISLLFRFFLLPFLA